MDTGLTIVKLNAWTDGQDDFSWQPNFSKTIESLPVMLYTAATHNMHLKINRQIAWQATVIDCKWSIKIRLAPFWLTGDCMEGHHYQYRTASSTFDHAHQALRVQVRQLIISDIESGSRLMWRIAHLGTSLAGSLASLGGNALASLLWVAPSRQGVAHTWEGVATLLGLAGNAACCTPPLLGLRHARQHFIRYATVREHNSKWFLLLACQLICIFA